MLIHGEWQNSKELVNKKYKHIHRRFTLIHTFVYSHEINTNSDRLLYILIPCTETKRNSLTFWGNALIHFLAESKMRAVTAWSLHWLPGNCSDVVQHIILCKTVNCRLYISVFGHVKQTRYNVLIIEL